MFRHARTDCAQSIAFQGDNVTYLEWWNANYPKQGSALQDATLRAWNAARLDLLEDQEKHGELQGDARVVAQPSPDYLRGIEDAAGMCDDEVGSAQHFIDKARGQPEAYVERLRLIKECAEGLASSIRGFKDPSVHDTPSEVLNPIRADRDAHEGQAIESDYSAGHAPGVARPEVKHPEALLTAVQMVLACDDSTAEPELRHALGRLHLVTAYAQGRHRTIPDTECLDCGKVKTECAEDCPRVKAGGSRGEPSPVARSEGGDRG